MHVIPFFIIFHLFFANYVISGGNCLAIVFSDYRSHDLMKLLMYFWSKNNYNPK